MIEGLSNVILHIHQQGDLQHTGRRVSKGVTKAIDKTVLLSKPYCCTDYLLKWTILYVICSNMCWDWRWMLHVSPMWEMLVWCRDVNVQINNDTDKYYVGHVTWTLKPNPIPYIEMGQPPLVKLQLEVQVINLHWSYYRALHNNVHFCISKIWLFMFGLWQMSWTVTQVIPSSLCSTKVLSCLFLLINVTGSSSDSVRTS